jgi:hypothetical protein
VTPPYSIGQPSVQANPKQENPMSKRLPTFHGSRLVGKRVVEVQSHTERAHTEGVGDRSTRTVLDAIVFDDGSELRFMVGEREDGRYDVIPLQIRGQ